MSKKEPILKVKSGVALRGARALWYTRLLVYAEHPVSEWMVSVTESPPSLPTRGKSAGKAEKPSGWLSWFVREGIVTIQE